MIRNYSIDILVSIQVYLYIMKARKKYIRQYINWLRNKKKYIHAKENKMNYKGDDIDE
ncbi:hypothetical protein ANS015_33220 [Paraclostridium bifermentans]|nr:hypothetical protein ANS015_33220 [Paraclostridium bifermentans]